MCFMSQNTSHVSPISIFNGLNFSGWNEQVQFYLGVLDLDLVILEEKFVTITDASSNKEKSCYKAWEKSNRLSLMFMRMTFADNIKTTLPKTDNVKESRSLTVHALCMSMSLR